MFEDGKINFNIIIYFTDNTDLVINSKDLISIGDLVSQIGDDSPISKSNNFDIEIADYIFSGLDYGSGDWLLNKKIKYVECLGKWKCLNVQKITSKYILTCSGFLQNLLITEFSPLLPQSGPKYIYNALKNIVDENINNYLDSTSLYWLTNNDNYLKLCDPQKISEFVLQPTGNYTHTVGSNISTVSNFRWQTFDFSLSGGNLDIMWPTYNNTISGNLYLHYDKFLTKCGNSIEYSTTNSPVNWCYISASLVTHGVTYAIGNNNLATPINSPVIVDNFSWSAFNTDAQTAGATTTQINYAHYNSKFINKIETNINTTGYFVDENCSLKMSLQPSPFRDILNSSGGTVQIEFYPYSIKNQQYNRDKIQQALNVFNKLLLETKNGLSIKTNDYSINSDIVLNGNNINNLHITSEFFKITDGPRIKINYLKAENGEDDSFEFAPASCYCPNKFETSLLNGNVAFNYYYINTRQYEILATFKNLRLCCLADMGYRVITDTYGTQHAQWQTDGTTQWKMADSLNNIYTLSNFLDANNTQEGSCLLNKNKKVAEVSSTVLKYATLNKVVPVNAFQHDLINVDNITGIDNLYDLGKHIIYQCDINLDGVDLEAGVCCYLKNINYFGDANKTYKIYIINRQTHLLDGYCTIQFIIIDSFAYKHGIWEKSHWGKNGNKYSLRDFNNSSTVYLSGLNHNTKRCIFCLENYATGFYKEYLITPEKWINYQTEDHVWYNNEINSLIFGENYSGMGLYFYNDETYRDTEIIIDSPNLPTFENMQIWWKWENV